MQKIRFSDFELDLELFTLKKGDQPIAIGRRSFDLLAYLVQNRERVITFATLRKEVWSDVALSDSAIPTCIGELRRVLGDDASNPKYIKSIRGRGYRFIGTVSDPLDGGNHPNSGIRYGTDLTLAGRKEELGTLKATLRSVEAKSACRLVFIRGEAGIGKSRLLSEFLSSIPGDIDNYTAHTTAIEGSPSFWPWSQIVRDALRKRSSAQPLLYESTRALASLFPEISEFQIIPDEPRVPNNRFSAYSLWSQTIRCLANRKTLILAFEDIHRADPDTLELMNWIALQLAQEPVMIVATHRPPNSADNVSRLLSEMATSSQSLTLDLPALSTEEIESALPFQFADREDISHALRYRSGGIPFYVVQLVRYLNEHHNQKESGGSTWELPVNAHEIVSRQLSDLPPNTRHLLELASVLGVHFSITAVSNLAEMPTSDILDRLKPAEESMLIRSCGESYAFAHAILRDALYRTVPSRARRDLHLSAAKYLAAHHGCHRHFCEISDHFDAASPISTAQDRLAYAILAARSAADRFAYSRAQIYFRRAIEQLEGSPDEETTDRGNLLLELARSQLYSGDRHEARSTLLEAARIARKIRSPELLSDCALQLAPDFLSIEVGVYDATLVRLLQDAIDMVEDRDMGLRAQLIARLCEARRWEEPNAQGAIESLVQDALSLARSSGDSHAIRSSLQAYAEFLHGPDRVKERLAAIEQLQAQNRPESENPTSMTDRIRQIAALLESGDIALYTRSVQDFDEAAIRLNLPQFLWYPLAFKATLAIMQGRLSLADELGEQFTAISARTGDGNVLASRACQVCALHLERELAAKVVPIASDFVVRSPMVKAWAAGLGLLSLRSKDVHRAMQILSSFDEASAQHLFHEAGGGAGVAFLSELAIETPNSTMVGSLYELISPVGSRGATLGYGMGYFGCFARYAGLLAGKLGLSSEALEHLRLAVALDGQRHASVYEAHAQLDLANEIVDSGGNAQEVNQLVQSAILQANKLDLERVQTRALAMKEKFSGDTG